MKILQLFKDGSEIIASDGIMYVDGRFNMNSIINEVYDRNSKMKNFPHKIADSFAIYTGGRIGSSLSKIIKL